MPKTRLAITMGDPAGIGPEVSLMLLAVAATEIPEAAPIIFGDLDLLARVARRTGLPLPDDHQMRQIDSPVVPDAVVPGTISQACGQASYNYLLTAIDTALGGEVDAIVTAPINKEALRAAGIPFPGHTEILADRTDSPRYCMMQFSDEVTATFVTCHCGYAEVPERLSRERLCEVFDLTHEALTRIKKRSPRIVVLGLNPHAGEKGLFGKGEEEAIIIPEIESARKRGIDLTGPVPPDTAFIPSMRGSTDAFVCMYHDQGHIPLKALAFDKAVNVTLGLPIVRTSVDHGTAFDIAWRGEANPGSMFSAARLAVELSQGK
ncbi:MAG: 4-hydroxythreonine-4-phosphate dehydrogenase PdxA [Verrucomicrobiota bacterium]